MSLRLFRTDDPSERETEALLAWYVNGTLTAPPPAISAGGPGCDPYLHVDF